MAAMLPSLPTAPDAGQPTMVQWFALAPLVVGAATLPAALVLALAVPAVVVIGRLLAGPASRAMPAQARLPVTLLAVASAIGVAVLGLRAAWPGLGDAPGWLLPLALACALPLTPGDPDKTFDFAVRDGLRLGARFALVVAAIAILRSALEPVLPLLGRPAGVLVLTGLVLAAAQWFRGRGTATESAP
jgi:Na+-translocating ferredoxin:NAD+ oxidoreductase RnfE subunit